jgi:hypothetical protein
MGIKNCFFFPMILFQKATILEKKSPITVKLKL